jgi:hypothetical protein
MLIPANKQLFFPKKPVTDLHLVQILACRGHIHVAEHYSISDMQTT